MKPIRDRGEVLRVEPLETAALTRDPDVQPPLNSGAFAAKAVLFDMDGVLSINGHSHAQAWRRFAWENLALETALYSVL